MAGSEQEPAASLPGGRVSVDVAVIGAGHNGLVAACYLAKAGLRVTVVEASDLPGGMTASGPLIAAAPEHVINSCAVDIISMLHSQVPRDLDLRNFGLTITKPDPSYVALHPDGATLALWRDPARTAAEIEQFSRADAREFSEFMRLLDGVITTVLPLMGTDTARPPASVLLHTARQVFRNRRDLSEITALVTGSASSAVAGRFSSPVVAGALLNLAGGAGPVDLPGSGLGFLLLSLLSRVGVGRPVGGMQSLTTALVNRLAAGGGTVVTGVAVEEILTASGRACGVRLADGRVLTARAVIATCDPWLTLRKLVPGDLVDRKTAARLDFAPANRGGGPLKIDMALSERITVPNHVRTDEIDLRSPTLLIGTAESVRESYAAAARGDLPDDPALWVVAPSGVDPSQAPPGQDSLYIYSLAAPVQPRPGGWAAARGQAADDILAKLGKYVAPLQQAEIGRLVETPADMAARLRVRNGCITHIDMGLLNSGPLRPAVGLGLGKTPVDGLFLGGSGIHPGGGVSGLPGRTAARRALRFLRQSPVP
jgi:phytoene dehydrogenase-like protein